MIIYLLKTIACSGLLWCTYKLFLENEKMNYFKRFYLLFSIVFSYVVPLFVFTLPQHTEPVIATITALTPADLPIPAAETYTNQPPVSYSLSNILLVVYGIITIYFLYRFVSNLWWLYKKAGSNKVIHFSNGKLVLVNEDIIPYSFLHYIFISASAYNGNRMEEKIMAHEMTHVHQNHSIDIIILELLRAICWFNPFLYAYKKSMQLNHEFLADGYVIKTCNDIPSYQYLLLNAINDRSNTLLTSQFNFLTTKKRFIMMTKHTTYSTIFFKVLVVTAIIFITGYTFSERVAAQGKNKSQPQSQPQPAKQISSGAEGVSQETLNEYKNIIAKYTIVKDSSAVYNFRGMTAVEKDRLKTIFLNMSKEQQSVQHFGFGPPLKPLPRIVPTKSQLESWKNAGIYGVWINEKKVKNAVLDNYINTDFAQVFISKLYGAAKRNVSYSYQVDLMTKDYYQDYYDKTIADTSYVFFVGMPRRIAKDSLNRP